MKVLNVPPCIKDHMRCMLTGKIKCGTFWDKILGHNERAFCSFCKKKQNNNVIETEEHMWLGCENSRQAQVWNMTKRTWQKSTDREWPTISLCLIRGAAALAFEEDFDKDSERLCILITMTIWAIWKSKLKNSINNLDIAPNEMTQVLKDLISDLVRRNWNKTHFMEEGRWANRQRELQQLWADSCLTKFDPKTGPTVNFS